MFRRNVSPEEAAIRPASAAATPAASGSSVRSEAIFAGAATRPSASGSVLFTQPHLLGADMAEQARRPHDQHDDEDGEPHRLLERRIDVESGEGLGDPDDEAA